VPGAQAFRRQLGSDLRQRQPLGLEGLHAGVGHVSDVHFTPMWPMMLTVEKESIIVRMPALCPHCHSDQVVQRGKTTVQI